MAYIKICGITKENEIEYLNEAKPDFAGFVQFFPKSKRNISIERAKELKSKLIPDIKSVAVTVKPTLDQIKAIEDAGFDYIQIHGNLEDAVLEQINIPVFKAFNVEDMAEYEKYSIKDIVAGYVFDANVPGSGKTFDWQLINSLPKDNKITLIAGGINCYNALEALKNTGLSGVDTSSGVENDNGIGKSREKIKAFVKNVRQSGL